MITECNVVWNTVGAICSAIATVAALASVYLLLEDRKLRERQIKREAIRKFLENRFDISGRQIKGALDDVSVAFQDMPEVQCALGQIREIEEPFTTSTFVNLMDLLLEAMCKAAHVNPNSVSKIEDRI